MYVVVECLTIVAVIALFTTLLLAGSMVLVALGEGINWVRQKVRRSAELAVAQESSGSLQPVVLTSTEPVAR
jgi:hypothetical protein